MGSCRRPVSAGRRRLRRRRFQPTAAGDVPPPVPARRSACRRGGTTRRTRPGRSPARSLPRGGGRSVPRCRHCRAPRNRMRLYTDRMATKEEVLEVLRQVEDPELGMDIVDLGLLYDVEVENSTAKVTYSLTSMGCPAGPLIAQDIDSAIRQVEGIQDVELELTFDPPWTPDKMSDDAKFILGFG